LARVMARQERANRSSLKRPIETFVLPMSAASSFTRRIVAVTPRRARLTQSPVLDSPAIPLP
jgi:hypothetical protein